jgi:hypothetical protein
MKHCYYASVPDQPTFYQDSWLWYGGRFAQDDDFFAQHGLYPYWMLEEGGACQATVYPTAASYSFTPQTSERQWPNSVARIKRNAAGEISNIIPVTLDDLVRWSKPSRARVKSDPIVSLNPGAGWKACGTIQRYRDELLWCHAWYHAWNQAHDNRLVGVALFTTGQYNWPLFDLQGSDLDLVTAALAGVL